MRPAQIVNLPAPLARLERPITLSGETQAYRKDGSVDIQTRRGTVTVRIDPPPAQGQKVDLYIQPGNPPRDAAVRIPDPRPAAPPNADTVDTAQPAAAQRQPAQPLPVTQTGRTQSAPATQQPAPAVDGSATPPASYARPVNPAAAQPVVPGKLAAIIPLNPALQSPRGLASLPLAEDAAPPLRQAMQTVTPAYNTPAIGRGVPIPPTALLSILIMPRATGTVTPPLISLQSATISQTGTAPHITGHSATITAPGMQTAPVIVSGGPAAPAASPLLTSGGTGALPPDPLGLVPSLARVEGVRPPGAFMMTNDGVTQPLSFLSGGGTSSPSASPATMLAVATGRVTPAGQPVFQITPGGTSTQQAGSPLTAAIRQGAVPPVYITFPGLTGGAAGAPGGAILLSLGSSGQSLSPQATPLMTAPAQTSAGPASPSLSMPQTAWQSLAGWPLLQEAADIITASLTAAQAQSFATLIPGPGGAANSQFTAAALLFIAAARGGDIAGWLGTRGEQALKGATGRRDTLALLTRDIANATGRAPSPAEAQSLPPSQSGGEWRGYTLPFMLGNAITRMELWTRPFGEDESDASKGPGKGSGVRFIVDVTMTRMGRVVCDGLIMPRQDRLELVVRTEHAFTDNARRDMRRLWAESLSSLGLSGGIDFQTA